MPVNVVWKSKEEQSQHATGSSTCKSSRREAFDERYYSLPLNRVECAIFYKLLLVSLLWLCFMLHVLWPDTRAATRPMPPTPTPPPRKRSKAPQPFAGLSHKPLCAACEQATDSPPKAPGAPPPLIVSTRGASASSTPRSSFVRARI